MAPIDANRTIERVSNALLVIVNPTAGGGRAARLVPWLHERLAARPDARVEVTRHAGHAERLAASVAPSEAGRIVAVGGDGTVQEVVNGMMASGAEGASLGIVPVGTGNDLARSLGLPRDPAAAWTVAIGRGERRVDLMRATSGDGGERWFGSAGGIGFDAQVASAMAERSGWQRGRAGYLLTTLSELRRFDNRSVELTLDGVTATAQVLFVAVANGEYYGGGMRIAPGAQLDDGILDLCIVGNVSRLTALAQLANLYRGTHVNHPQVEMRRGRSISVTGDPATLVHLDGEPFGGLPLRVDVHPSCLTIATPLR
jgi:YegS/Rv2252/BmrU family lipid kinase